MAIPRTLPILTRIMRNPFPYLPTSFHKRPHFHHLNRSVHTIMPGKTSSNKSFTISSTRGLMLSTPVVKIPISMVPVSRFADTLWMERNVEGYGKKKMDDKNKGDGMDIRKEGDVKWTKKSGYKSV